MKIKMSYISCIVGASLLFGGCAGSNSFVNKVQNAVKSDLKRLGYGSEKNFDKLAATSEDPYLAKAFKDIYEESQNKKGLYVQINHQGITIKQRLAYFDKMSLTSKTYWDYINSLDLDNDRLARKYKEAIKARGNSYRVYKGSLVEKNITSKTNFSGTVKSVTGGTTSIIEYDQSGRMVSGMFRTFIITPNPMGKNDPDAPIKLEMLTTIFFKTLIKNVENKYTNSYLQDHILYQK